MAGLGELFGLGENPYYQWWDKNRNAATGALSEFGGKDMLAAAKQGASVDRVVQQQKAEEQDRQRALQEAIAQKNRTLEFLGQQFPDLAQAFEAGVPLGDLYNEALRRKAGAPAQAPIRVGAGETLYDPNTMQPIFTAPSEAKAPSVPSGYRLTPDGNLQAIPGGPADKAGEQAQDAEARRAAAQQTEATIDVTQDAIDKALMQTNMLNAGLPGAVQSMVPGSPAYDLRATIDTVKANLGFQALQQMRLASPTGGALGQVTERELAFLQSTVASLDANQSPEQLAANLAYVKQRLEAIRRLTTAGMTGGQSGSGGYTILGVE